MTLPDRPETTHSKSHRQADGRDANVAGRPPHRVPMPPAALRAIEANRAWQLERSSADLGQPSRLHGANRCKSASPPAPPSTKQVTSTPHRRTLDRSSAPAVAQRPADAILRLSEVVDRPRCTTPASSPPEPRSATAPRFATSPGPPHPTAARPSSLPSQLRAHPHRVGSAGQTPDRTRAPHPACAPPTAATRQEVRA